MINLIVELFQLIQFSLPFYVGRSHYTKRNELGQQYRDHRWQERNDALVNTSTLAWTYTGDVEEKGEQEEEANAIINAPF